MNIRHLFFLLTMPVCCFAETGKSPVRDYKMIDLNNGVTVELLTVGPTSITFSVERLVVPERGETTWCHLIGKLDIEKRGWYHLTELNFEQPYGKTIFEIPYSRFTWYDVDEYKSAFEEKAWLAVLRPFDPADSAELREYRGMYSEGNEENDEAALEVDEFRAKVLAREAEEHREERERFAAAEERKRVLVDRLVHESNEERFAERARLDALGATEEEQKAAEARLIAKFKQRLSDALARLAAEEAAGEATASPPNRLWLYVGILFALSAIFYFVRRKLKTGN